VCVLFAVNFFPPPINLFRFDSVFESLRGKRARAQPFTRVPTRARGPTWQWAGVKGRTGKKMGGKKVGAGIEATCRSSWGRTMTSWGGFVAGPICPWATRGVDGQGSGQTWNFFELVILFWNC
jgi:hypothetical protein